MGKLYTSRYANKNLAKDENLVKVGISQGRPKFKIDYEVNARLIELAPSREIFGITNRERFNQEYKKQLDRIGINTVIELLRGVGLGEKDIVLLCFEDITSDNNRNNWCHRTSLAEWLSEYGLDSEEYPDDTSFASKAAKKKEKEEAEKERRRLDEEYLENQMTLF